LVSERLPNSYLDKIEFGEPMGLLYTGKNLRLYSGDFRKDGTTQYQIRFVDTRDAYRCQHAGCGVHLQAGRRSPHSAVVHHLKPHKGDLELFFDLDNLQSVCWTCHSGDIQSTEALGYDRTIGNDGWPIDPKHPSSI
jgi:hypothetical protein